MQERRLSDSGYNLSNNGIILGDFENSKAIDIATGELGYDRLNGTRKIGPSYAKFVAYILRVLDMHQTGTKHIVHHMQKSVVQWSVISKLTCIVVHVRMNKEKIHKTKKREKSSQSACIFIVVEWSSQQWEIKNIF